MTSGLSCFSLFNAENMLEIAPNPTETWELCSREGRVAVWNQQEPTRHLVFSHETGLLHTAEHDG